MTETTLEAPAKLPPLTGVLATMADILEGANIMYEVHRSNNPGLLEWIGVGDRGATLELNSDETFEVFGVAKIDGPIGTAIASFVGLVARRPRVTE